jgi:hypothetical protein
MIWPFKKLQEYKAPPFTGVEFVDTDGIRYEYKPAKTIPPYEVALLLPLFMTTYMNADRFAYIRQHKLEKHFKQIKEPIIQA